MRCFFVPGGADAQIGRAMNRPSLVLGSAGKGVCEERHEGVPANPNEIVASS